jgi:ferredoxin
MNKLSGIETSELRDWLEHVRGKESAQWLMLAIAHKQGVAVDDLVDWYDVDERAIRDWFDDLESGPLVTAIAEKEGVDIDALAEQYGLSAETIRNWFTDLADDPPEEAIDVIARYNQQRSVPVFRQTESQVYYLAYDVLEDEGWSVTDNDLFEKASQASLDPEQYGRIVVKPGETILEAAENRGFSWPYACRAGACANCAVLVKDGDVAMPGNNVLSDEQVNVMNARLTCVGVPVTEEVKLIMDVQQLDQFSDLRLPSPLGEPGGEARL